MDKQKEKATCEEVANKCPICSNEKIQDKYNFCPVCGIQLKENPDIIDFCS